MHGVGGAGVQMHRSVSQQRMGVQRASIYPVDVAEWVFEPRSSSKSASRSRAAPPDAFLGPITFRTWDFDGIKQVVQTNK